MSDRKKGIASAAFAIVLIFLISVLIFACRAEAVEKETIIEPAAEEAEAAVAEEEVAEEQPEPEEETPQNILDRIASADAYYNEGEYSLAVKEYRNAIIAIDGSDLPEAKKQELEDGIDANYQSAIMIVDTARTHHGNAKQLEYEKRFEEAKEELEEALAIYPEYQTAIDTLASLEALAGLN